MDQASIERELHSCGYWFFVEYFDDFKLTEWSQDKSVTALQNRIADDLRFKKRPDGGSYTFNGLQIRLASVFIIFQEKSQWLALDIIQQSTRADVETKKKAQGYIYDHKMEEARRITEERAAQERQIQEQNERLERERAEKVRKDLLRIERETPLRAKIPMPAIEPGRSTPITSTIPQAKPEPATNSIKLWPLLAALIGIVIIAVVIIIIVII